MHLGSLERLLETARALPGERQHLPMTAPTEGTVGPPAATPPAATPPATTPPATPPIDLSETRKRFGALLAELSERLGPTLIEALRRAEYAWDQFDAVSILDAKLTQEAEALRRLAQALEADEDAARRAAGLELVLSLDAALGLVGLVERRLATLVRLRLRADDPVLIPRGRPFLDVASALAEAARGWR